VSTPSAAQGLPGRPFAAPESDGVDDAACMDDGAWAAASRRALVEIDETLAVRFDRAEDVDALVAARAQAVDGIVRSAWLRCFGDGCEMSLFAVGGYGRGELFPQSDVDLLVFADAANQATHLTRSRACSRCYGTRASRSATRSARRTNARRRPVRTSPC
jgi:uncharacterized protein CbrC (UPF0167 family)